MRWPPVAMLLSCTVGCGQVLGLGDFGAGGAGAAGQGGSAGEPEPGGHGGTGGQGGAGGGVTGGGGAAPGGGGQGGAGCGDGYRLAVEADSPLAYIRFEEAMGPTVTGENGLVGTVGTGVDLNEPPLVACGGTSAARFPGDGAAFIDFGEVLAFDGKSQFSIEVWVSAAAHNSFILRRFSAGATNNGYALRVWNSELEVLRYSDNSGADVVGVDSTIFGFGGFHHVVGTYDGAAEMMCLYVDGVQRLCEQSLRSIDFATAEFLIGQSGFEGVIDEVAVYASVLSQQRVAAHYAAATSSPD